MSSYVFAAPEHDSVAIQGIDARFAVHRVICVGRNYADHAREMGKDPDKEPPFFFFKPVGALVDSGGAIAYPPLTSNLHHEIELVVAIGADGRDVAVGSALELVYGYAVGLDMTRRDLQLAAREAGRPWDWGKGFDQSAPCGPIRPVSESGHPTSGHIWLTVNGEQRQSADLADLIWAVPEIITFASRAMVLKAGDLIFTGTPAGVGPVVPGDGLSGGIDGVGEIQIRIID